MAYVTQLNTAHAQGESRVAGMIATVKDMLARRRVYRTTMKELNALSSRDLNDLGLNRSMLTQVAREAAYGTAD